MFKVRCAPLVVEGLCLLGGHPRTSVWFFDARQRTHHIHFKCPTFFRSPDRRCICVLLPQSGHR